MSKGACAGFDVTNDSSNHVRHKISSPHQKIDMETLFLDAMLKTNQKGAFELDSGSENGERGGINLLSLQEDLQGVCKGVVQALEQQIMEIPQQKSVVENAKENTSKQPYFAPNDVNGDVLATTAFSDVVSDMCAGKRGPNLQQGNYFPQQATAEENVVENIVPTGEKTQTDQLVGDLPGPLQQPVRIEILLAVDPSETSKQPVTIPSENLGGASNFDGNSTLDPNAEVCLSGFENSYGDDTSTNLGKIRKVPEGKKPSGKNNKRLWYGPPNGYVPYQPYVPPVTRSRAASSGRDVSVSMENVRVEAGGGSHHASRGSCYDNRFESFSHYSDNDEELGFEERDFEAYQTARILEDKAYEKAHHRKWSY